MNLEIKNIEKKYDNTSILNDISFTLQPGIYGLLGANGAGKSTLLRIICGVTRANKGTVNYNNTDIFERFENYRSILGFLPQEFKYYPELTGLKFMMYIAALKGVDKKSARERCEELLKIVGLNDVKNKKIRKYSGGMKQRLGIAQVMINDPKILILDEPTVGLDPKERIKFRNLIGSLSNEKIVILSTHIVSDVAYIADEILIIKKGCLINRGIATELVKEIEGQVWECSIPQKMVAELSTKYIVSNQKHEDDRLILRVISKNRPEENAIQVEPTLEDLYLYYFREEETRLTRDVNFWVIIQYRYKKSRP